MRISDWSSDVCSSELAAVVALDRDHPCAGTEQRARQAAGTGTDLEHRLAIEIAGQCGDAVEELFVEQEILPERLARREAVRAHRVAKRRDRKSVVEGKSVSVRFRSRWSPNP